MALLDPNYPRSPELLRICSLCKRVALPDNRLPEVEEAIHALKLFGRPELPRITHTACPDCFRVVMAELDRL